MTFFWEVRVFFIIIITDIIITIIISATEKLKYSLNKNDLCVNADMVRVKCICNRGIITQYEVECSKHTHTHTHTYC